MVELLLGAPLGGEGTLVFTTPTSWLVGAVVCAVAVLGLAWWSGRRNPPVVPELALLAPALAVVVFAAAGPVWVEENGRLEAPRFAVLIDDSASMSVLEDGTPRSASVASALAQIDGDRVDIYRFGSTLSVGGEATYSQPGTDLGAALSGLSDRYAGERLAGVAIITDGIDRGGVRRLFNQGILDPPELPGPLTLYQVGEPSEVNDLSVTSVSSGGFAFIHSTFEVTATLSGTGYEGRRIAVYLQADGKPLAEQVVQLDETGQATVTFPVLRTQPGRTIYEVSVPVLDGDAVPGNNSMPVAVRVVRDRLRVLQVCGAPSLDEKFLRLFLKQDPSVDLVSFFILRTNDDLVTDYRESELSLIAFPYMTLFDEELDSFDLVIFQNFDYAEFFRGDGPRLLGNIERFVKEGKAFVMMGGDRSFDLGEYHDTPIGDILPVELGLQAEQSTDLDPFEPVLTDAGRVHPVTRLLGSGLDNEALWGRLPAMDGLNLSVGLAPGSAQLLSHPTLKAQNGSPMPLLAVREVGEGRTMALMGDSSWRWVMTEAARGNGNQGYLRFWKNAIRWLVKDRDGQRVRVDTAKENVVIGDTVRVIASVRDVGFEAQAGVAVQATVSGPGEVLNVEGITDELGEVVFEVPATRRGAWTVQAVAGPARSPIGVDQTSFAVTDRDPELDDIRPDSAFLMSLAAKTGGQYYAPGEYGEPLWDEDAARRVEEVIETPLWSAPVIPLLAGLFLSLSWFLRRRRGLR